jgi:transposase
MLELRMNEAKILRRQGKKISDIAQALGKSERTVYYYLSQETRARKQRHYPSKLNAYKSFIDSILKDTPDYNRVVLADRLHKIGYDGGMSILREYAAQKQNQITTQAVIRFETEPGYQAQVDWKEHGTKIVDGKKQKLYAFNMVFGFSREPFVMHTTNMEQSTFLACHVKAFEYFGGVPREILYDNMKTAFILNEEGIWKPNKHLMALANHYGFVPRRCRVRRPQTKGKVERFIDYYTNNFWLRVKHEPLSLAVLNEKVADWIHEINKIPVRHLKASRAERFEVEKRHLLPLPKTHYVCKKELEVKVSRESLIAYKTNWYSVPPEFIGKTVKLSIDPFQPVAEVYHQDAFIRSLELETQEKYLRRYRPEDKKALYRLWEKQQTRSERKRTVETDVAVRLPREYEKLLLGQGAAL